jgi:hypothetical protein
MRVSGAAAMSDADRIRSALAYIRPSDWDVCIEMAKAIKHELGDAGFSIWDEWVRQGGWFGQPATWKKPAGYIDPDDRETIGPPDGWRPCDGDWWSGEQDGA